MKKLLKAALLAFVVTSALGFVACDELGGGIEPPHICEWEERIEKEPTCTEAGEKIFECVCGSSHSEWIAPLEHDYEEFPEQEGTCKTPGIAAHGVCKREGCGYSSAHELEINPNNHTFDENRVCTECEKVSATELKYKISDDETYYIVTDGTECKDTEIMIPSTYEGLPVKEIGERAFQYMTTVREVFIPETVAKIGEMAFENSSLEKAVIPNSVTEIGDDAFSANNITEISVGEDNQNYKSIDGSLYTKDGKVLLQYAKGRRVTEFIMPSSVEIIVENAFANDLVLTSITLSENLREIHFYAFANCSSLAEIEIGDKVELIEASAFANTVYESNEENWEDGALYLGKYLIGSKEDIISENYVVKAGTLGIGYGALSFNPKLKSVTIPSSVKYINNTVFVADGNLKSITFENPNGWTATYPSYFGDYGYTEEKTKTFTAQELSDPANNVIIFIGTLQPGGWFEGPCYSSYNWSRNDNAE